MFQGRFRNLKKVEKHCSTKKKNYAKKVCSKLGAVNPHENRKYLCCRCPKVFNSTSRPIKATRKGENTELLALDENFEI